jgi:uncharacterized membrane protein YdbT with pleckstrin-like domain
MKHLNITRQSIFILITELVVLEAIVSALGYLIKLPLINGWAMNLFAYTGITLFIQLLNILFIVVLVLRWVTTEYRIEKSSLIIKSGILSTNEQAYPLESVKTVQVNQSWIGKIFNFGTIHVYSPLFLKHIYIMNIPEAHQFGEEIRLHIPADSKIQMASRRVIDS